MELRNKQNFYAAEAKKNFEQKVIIRQFSSLSQSVDIFDLQCREGPTSQNPMRSSVAATNAQRVPSSIVYVTPSHGSTLSRHVTTSTTCLNICRNKTRGSNTIMLKSFAMKFRSNKTIDDDIILSFTLIDR